MPRIRLQWDGGVNNLVDSGSIQDNQVESSKNAFPNLSGTLDKRESVSVLGGIAQIVSDALQLRPITLFVPDPVLGIDFILYGTLGLNFTGEIFCIVRLNQTGLQPTNEYAFFNTSKTGIDGPAVLTNYKGRVLGVTGTLTGFYQLSKDSSGNFSWVQVTFKWVTGTPGTVKGQQQQVDVVPRVVGTYRGRVIYANFGVGKGNWLIFGDRDPQVGWTNVTNAPTWAIVGDDVLSDNGRHLELAAIQGEDIIGIREISLQAVGSPLQTALLVLTKKTAIICTGEVAQTTDTAFATAAGYIGDFTASKVNFEVGLAGPNCICETRYGLCWASDTEVWLMNGNIPTPVGTTISSALRDTPPALRRFWSMAHANGVVYLAICTQASASELDLRIQHWRLDLRQGPERAAWYGPQDYEALPDWATYLSASPTMAASIVSKRGSSDRDIIAGAILTDPGFTNASYKTNVISFNESQGGEDIPFVEYRTAPVWGVSSVTNVGDLTRPGATPSNGRLFVATGAGTTDVIEPTWPDVAGGTVVDGSVTWTEILGTVNRFISSTSNLLYPSNLVDILFKELTFGEAVRDKLIRRADVNIFSSTKSLIALRILANKGDKQFILGPTPIGEPITQGEDNDATFGAGNQIDLFMLDTNALADECQARTLRPGFIQGHQAANPLSSWLTDDTGGAKSGGIIRGRFIQPRFTDDDGIVIDSTNDQFAWCSFQPSGNVILSVFNASLTQGRYNNIDGLLTEIKTQMNLVQGNAISGFTISSNPWSFISAFTGIDPYMTTITFTFSSRTANRAIGFLFGDFTGNNDATSLNGVSVYPIRTKRVLSILGLDTSLKYALTTPITKFFDDGNPVRLIGERQIPALLASPTRICGVQVVPYKRPPVLSINDIELDYYIKPGLPFSQRSR